MSLDGEGDDDLSLALTVFGSASFLLEESFGLLLDLDSKVDFEFRFVLDVDRDLVGSTVAPFVTSPTFMSVVFILELPSVCVL